MPLVTRDEQGNDVTSQYFDICDGELRIIRQDCLCYLMERIDLPEPATQD
jgi:hypothetical protein